MAFESIMYQIIEILRIEEQDLNDTSKEDLSDFLIKLKEAKKNLQILKKSAPLERTRLNSARRILDIKSKIKQIKSIIGEETTENKKQIKNKRPFNLNQKYQIIRKIGVLELMLNKYDVKLQYKIFSELFDCHEDTARKILCGTYKITKIARDDDFKSLMKRLNNIEKSN